MSDYTFHTLSDSDFEYFVCDLLNAEMKLDLHSYPAGRDQGIDLLQEFENGTRVVVQCKHYVRSDKSKLLKEIEKELSKNGYKGANRYILVTSSPVTALTESDIMRLLRIPQQDVWGPRRLNEVLARHPDVERWHYKLWLSSSGVLTSIINAGSWNRSLAMIEAATERAKYWVETPAYRLAFDLLERRGNLILTGQPGVGKTYLAEFMCLQQARLGWQVIYVAGGLGQAWQLLSPDDTRQLFFYPDPIGEADLSPTAQQDASAIRDFMAMIARRRDQNKRLIITTPTEVFKRAAQSGSGSLRRLADDQPSQLEISLGDWNQETRKQVLLNHLQFAGLSWDERRNVELDRRTISVVRHPSFNPRLIEMVCEQFTSDTTAEDALVSLRDALATPESVWNVSWAMLSELASEIVLTLATLRSRPVPISELRVLVGDAGPAKVWVDAWQSLQPIWITAEGPKNDRVVTLANPGLRDFLLGRLEDADMANERISKAATLEQLAELSRAAGDLAADVGMAPLVRRPVLAHLLRQRKGEIAERVRTYAETRRAAKPAALRNLQLAISLLGLYGDEDSLSWVMEQLAAVFAQREPPLQVVDRLSMAFRITLLPSWREAGGGDAVHRLCTDAIMSISTLSDLDALEAYADRLQIDLTVANSLAATIFATELSHLFDERDPEVVRTRAHELQDRAQAYGRSIEIDLLLDYADDIERV